MCDATNAARLLLLQVLLPVVNFTVSFVFSGAVLLLKLPAELVTFVLNRV